MAGGSKLLFRRTPALRASALKYNIPLKYSKAQEQMDSDHTKTVWDLPTAAEFAGQSYKNHNFKEWSIITFFLALLAMVPWKYEFSDFKDTIQLSMADEAAAQSYISFILELVTQRNRAYEWMRYQGRPFHGQNDIDQARPRTVATQGGYQGWDVVSGRPIHGLEKHGRIGQYYDSEELTRKYLKDTKSDMDRVREIRARITEIRAEMLALRGDMYKKTME